MVSVADLKELASHVSDKDDVDVILYEGEVGYGGYQAVSDICDGPRRNSAMLVLSTYGGAADAGFRIARALQHSYVEFTAVIAGMCKSAGTLICVGAHTLVMADRSELGPLDVQMQKHEELFEVRSGLDLFEALSSLQEHALDAFRAYLIDLRTGGNLGTKPASEIASQLVTGLFAPIYGQIDPLRVGELQRAVAIATAYGNLLNEKAQNLRPDALSNLVSGYPSHGFVIDRKEARKLFRRVEAATGPVAELCRMLRERRLSERPHVECLNQREINQGEPIQLGGTAVAGASSNNDSERPQAGERAVPTDDQSAEAGENGATLQ